MNEKLKDYIEVIYYSISKQLQENPNKKIIEIFIKDESSSLINQICDELVSNDFNVCFVPKTCLSKNHPKFYDINDYDSVLYVSWKNRTKLMLVY